MANKVENVGRDSRQKWGIWYANRFLFWRRLSQFSVLVMFLLSPYLSVWILKGNYSGSLFFHFLPMTDPLITAESLVTGYLPTTTTLLGALIVIGVYALLGSRVFCSWVCPMNVITDLANWLRRKLGIRQSAKLPKSLRYILLAIVLLGSAITGTLLWEWINPVSALGRGLIFGSGATLWLVLVVFLFDLFIVEHGFCGYICPMGAMYGVIGAKGIIRIKVQDRAKCTQCMDCYHICPEPQVLRSPLQGKKGEPLRVLSKDCITCGRCIDVCSEKIFKFTHRFDRSGE